MKRVSVVCVENARFCVCFEYKCGDVLMRQGHAFGSASNYIDAATASYMQFNAVAMASLVGFMLG